MSYPVFYPFVNDTLYIPWATYDGGTGASITMSGLAVTDIEIYKNGSVTQRSSDSGYTLLDTDGTDFDSTTGLHGISIDLSDNTDAGFYAADSQYWVVINSVTVDGQTVTFIAAWFKILPTVRGFAGTALPNAAADAAGGLPISDAGGLDLDARLDVAVSSRLAPTVAARTLDVTAGGTAGVDWANVEAPTATVGLSNTTVGTVSTLTGHTVQTGDTFAQLPTNFSSMGIEADGHVHGDVKEWLGVAPLALVAQRLIADMGAISGDSVAADRLEAMMDGVIVAQVNDAGATTTVFIADGFTEATDDHFNGRLITFLTGALAGQQTDITDYTGATQTFTVTALTEAPANDDFFVIH